MTLASIDLTVERIISNSSKMAACVSSTGVRPVVSGLCWSESVPIPLFVAMWVIKKSSSYDFGLRTSSLMSIALP